MTMHTNSLPARRVASTDAVDGQPGAYFITRHLLDGRPAGLLVLLSGVPRYIGACARRHRTAETQLDAQWRRRLADARTIDQPRWLLARVGPCRAVRLLLTPTLRKDTTP